MVAGVVKAVDIAPAAFTTAPPEELNKTDDLIYDVHHLTAFDNHAVDLERFKRDPEGYLKEVTAFGVQGLVARLFDLPTESSPVGPVATLPPKVTTLPRAKPIPPPRKETKWEKFAKEKGIKKNKRSRMVWDEASQEWKPRWGYKGANAGIEDIPIIEIKEGDDPFEDPWTKARQEKKARVTKNLKQQRANLDRGKPKASTFGLPVDLTTGKKDGEEGGGKRKKGKADGLKALEVAQRSTASIGRFDRQLEGEPEKKEKKVKKVAPAVDSEALKNEAKRMKDILQSVVRPKSAGGKPKHVNIDALEPESVGYKRKKGRGAEKGGAKRKKK